MADIKQQEGEKPVLTDIGDDKKVSPAPSLLKPEGHEAGFSSGNSNMSDAASAEKAVEPVGEPKPPREVHGIVWALVVLSMLSSTFLFALDNTIVADVQPAIVARFDSISKLPWLSVAFLVAAAGTNLIWFVACIAPLGRRQD